MLCMSLPNSMKTVRVSLSLTQGSSSQLYGYEAAKQPNYCVQATAYSLRFIS
jgi:hypothetical protein